MTNKNIYIIGIGHNSAVTIELAELNGYNIVGLLHYNDDLTGTTKWGYPIIASTKKFLEDDVELKCFALSMGDNKTRQEIFYLLKNKNAKIPPLVHPSASVSRFVEISEGVQIHANVTVQPDVTIHENSIISYGVGVSHNVTISSNCYIACHSLIGAYTIIEDNVLIGMGTTTISGKVPSIGSDTIVGAGSLVCNSIPKSSKVYGRPAK